MGVAIEFFLDYILPNAFNICGGLCALYIFSIMTKRTYDEYRMMQLKLNLIKGHAEMTAISESDYPRAVLQPGNWLRIKEAGVDRIGLLLVKEQGDKAIFYLSGKSLEMARSRISHAMGDYSRVVEEFENAIKVPKRKIAVIKVSMKNFKIGDQYFEFQPLLKVSKDAFFTYQNLSECCLATYLNDNGQKYLAGFLVYPDPTNFLDRNLKGHDVLIAMEQIKSEPFPHQDRTERLKNSDYKRYGRFCKNANRWVTVDCSENAMKVKHMEYDHEKQRFVFEECCECWRDAMGYKLEDSGEEGAMEIPRVLHHTEKWRVYEDEKGRSVVGVASAMSHCQWTDFVSVSMIWCVLKRRFEDSKKLSKTFENRLARNVLAVSIAEQHFEVGETHLDFKLATGRTSSPNAVFIHKKIAEGIQATYLSENEKEYLAGITYFLMMNPGDRLVPTEKAVIHLTQMAGEPYPPTERFTSDNYLKHKRYGRWCNGKRVVVDMNEGKAKHLEYNETIHKYETKHCLDCHYDSAMRTSEEYDELISKENSVEHTCIDSDGECCPPIWVPPVDKSEEHERRKASMQITINMMKMVLNYNPLRTKKSCKYLCKELDLMVRRLEEQVEEDYTVPYATGNFGSAENDDKYDDELGYDEEPKTEESERDLTKPFKATLIYPANTKDIKENDTVLFDIQGKFPKKKKAKKSDLKDTKSKPAVQEDCRKRNMKELFEKFRMEREAKKIELSEPAGQDQVCKDKSEMITQIKKNPFFDNASDSNSDDEDKKPLHPDYPYEVYEPEEPTTSTPPLSTQQNRKSSESSDDFEIVNKE